MIATGSVLGTTLALAKLSFAGAVAVGAPSATTVMLSSQMTEVEVIAKVATEVDAPVEITILYGTPFTAIKLAEVCEYVASSVITCEPPQTPWSIESELPAKTST